MNKRDGKQMLIKDISHSHFEFHCYLWCCWALISDNTVHLLLFYESCKFPPSGKGHE